MSHVLKYPNKYEIGDSVGYNGQVWEVCGRVLSIGYAHADWMYFLISSGWEGEQQCEGSRNIPESKIVSAQTVIDEQIAQTEKILAGLNELKEKTQVKPTTLKKNQK